MYLGILDSKISLPPNQAQFADRTGPLYCISSCYLQPIQRATIPQQMSMSFYELIPLSSASVLNIHSLPQWHNMSLTGCAL